MAPIMPSLTRKDFKKTGILGAVMLRERVRSFPRSPDPVVALAVGYVVISTDGMSIFIYKSVRAFRFGNHKEEGSNIGAQVAESDQSRDIRVYLGCWSGSAFNLDDEFRNRFFVIPFRFFGDHKVGPDFSPQFLGQGAVVG